MKHFSISILLLLLAGCSSEPSGTYASATEDGRVLRDPASGLPFVTMTLDEGKVVVKKAGDSYNAVPRLGTYQYVDNTVFIESGTGIAQLKVEGDLLLVPDGMGEFKAFKKL